MLPTNWRIEAHVHHDHLLQAVHSIDGVENEAFLLQLVGAASLKAFEKKTERLFEGYQLKATTRKIMLEVSLKFRRNTSLGTRMASRQMIVDARKRLHHMTSCLDNVLGILPEELLVPHSRFSKNVGFQERSIYAQRIHHCRSFCT